MKVLVVDDSATMRRIIVNSLNRVGYTDTVEAADGQEGLAKMDASIGFIIADWNMPNINGIEMLKVMREQGWITPALIVVARSVREVKELCECPEEMVVKPFTPAVLGEKMADILRSLTPVREDDSNG